MGIDDEDLERAGTRSRRQLTNSKKYSVYPPPLEKEEEIIEKLDEQGENHHHPLEKTNNFLSKLVKSKPRTVAIFCFVFTLLFIGLYQSPSIYLPSRRDTSTLFEQTLEFNDSSQYTDYALLNKLLIEKKGLLQK
jgi:hypothetical protein